MSSKVQSAVTLIFSWTEHPFAHISVAAIFLVFIYHVKSQSQDFPYLNPKKRFALTASAVRKEFMTSSRTILSKGRFQYPDTPCMVNSEWGEVLVLPPHLINELRNDPRLDYLRVTQDDSHAYIPGFEPSNSDPKLSAVITRHLTKVLAKLTKPISDETTLALQQSFTDSQVWHEISLATYIPNLISRLSSRVFMGEALSRNESWVQASARYAAQNFASGDDLRAWSRPVRPLVHWFLPSCRETRRQLAETRGVLEPLIKERESNRRDALARGENLIDDDHCLEWFEQELDDGYDPATALITLSMVAIHTTSDLLQATMLNIARHPELFKPLREEIISVLQTHGLTKQGLYDLKLLDSTLKESQRLKPVMLVTWRRAALEEVKVSTGLTIRKGQRIAVSNAHMWDSAYYHNPDRFDPYRFLRMREIPAEQSLSQLVTTSEKHLGFGHGNHACPGRFFAANELKIALCHLLLKYDWKLPDDHEPQPISHGMTLGLDPNAMLLVRRRKEEINLDSL
ncbi:hypothetical protein PFICI_12431 [Pestalotiopsis fici W106-1]|uniref:Uncharacterized protein n=1 Tax=Pestalotiopsis fici (strain W106-1 / CGMCC3.15140) TaxID=1229662 RepID=W3WQR1_PESFW|nr:uncharacterized protein PFICI_12431 [Pestalotiopsis fici W106-1]ETS75487.1 hypothetical protein PFICI_12431 [Pestalotiopsis fici W106-1]